MKKILALFLFVASFVTIQSQTPYDTVNVRDPQNFVEMTTVDTAYFQLIGRKANLNRRMSLTTLKNWILAGVDGIDTVYWSGDTLNILQGLTLWQAVADDNSGLFDASNNNDTIRVSTALLRAALTFTQGANAITFSGSGSNTIVVSNSSSVGVNASGGTFGGIFSSGSASGVGVRGSSAGASGVPIDAANSYTGTTNDERPGLRLRRSGIYTGAPGNGIYASFYSRYGYSGDAETARISGVSRDTSASGSGELNFYVRNAGTITKRGTIAGSGQLTLDGYANNALNNVDSSLYLLAVDATGDVHTRAASTLADGNGIISELPVGDVVIGANNHSLFIDSLSFVLHQGTGAFVGYPHWGWVVFSGLGEGGPFMGVESSQNGSALITASPTILSGDTLFYAKMLYISGDSIRSEVMASKYGVQITADTLDATGVTTFLGFPSGGAIDSISYYGDTLRIYEGGDLTPFKAEIVAGADTDDQTLSTSRDTITIADGNSVRTPGVGFLRDSITGATKTLDLKKYSQAIYVIKMESATSVTLTINNPWSEVSGSYPTQEGETGVYTFRFAGISGTDNVTWPANFYDMGGTALGTDALTAGTAYTCFYDPVEAKYYCK